MLGTKSEEHSLRLDSIAALTPGIFWNSEFDGLTANKKRRSRYEKWRENEVYNICDH